MQATKGLHPLLNPIRAKKSTVCFLALFYIEIAKIKYRAIEKFGSCIYDEYIGTKCIFERNRFMVNNSSLLIALFSGKNGGTKSTIEYAKKQGLNIVIIEP